MKNKKVLFLILYLLAILLPTIVYLAVTPDTNIILKLAGALGITSYAILCLQFLLVSRPKFIDRYIGLDKIYRFHMKISILAFLMAFVHKTLKEMYFSESTQTEFGDIAFNIFIVISVFSLLMMVNKLFIKVKPIDYIRKLLNNKLKIKYQYKVLLHNITLIALAVLLIHIQLAYSVSSSLLLRITLLLYFAVPLAFYINRKLLKVYLSKNNQFVVSDVVQEAGNIVTLRFKPRYDNRFSYLPGQFLYLKLQSANVPGDEHPFTISSSPERKGDISITAKQLGDFTNNLNKVKIGDSATITGGYGAFTYVKYPDRKMLCFIAGGIGITPFLSMIRYMHDHQDDTEVVLLWGIRNLSEAICKEELEDYTRTLKNFRFVPVLSHDESYSGEKGLINSDLIKKYVEHPYSYDFYICGPPIMLDIQLKNLNALEVPSQNIHYERFSI